MMGFNETGLPDTELRAEVQKRHGRAESESMKCQHVPLHVCGECMLIKNEGII